MRGLRKEGRLLGSSLLCSVSCFTLTATLDGDIEGRDRRPSHCLVGIRAGFVPMRVWSQMAWPHMHCLETGIDTFVSLVGAHRWPSPLGLFSAPLLLLATFGELC